MPKTKSYETKSAPVEVKGWETKQQDGDEVIDTVTLEVSVFDVVDDEDDIVEKGAFRKTLSERVAANKVKLVDNHQYSVKDTIGTVISGTETKSGLRVKVKVSRTDDAQAAAKKMQEGHVNQFSIGYIVHEREFDKVNGKRVRKIKELELKEVTASAVVVNDETGVISVNTKGYKKMLDQLDAKGKLEKKADWPDEAPFDDFSGCVQFYNSHPAVDYPGSFCAQLRAGVEDFIAEGEEKAVRGVHGDQEMENFIETTEVVSTKAALGGLELKALSRQKVESIVRIVGVVLRDRLEDRLDELPEDLLDSILNRILSSVSNDTSDSDGEVETAGTHPDDEEEEEEHKANNKQEAQQVISDLRSDKDMSFEDISENLSAVNSNHDSDVSRSASTLREKANGESDPSDDLLSALFQLKEARSGDSDDTEESTLKDKFLETKSEIIEGKVRQGQAG